jgi:hypothetical protein
VIVEQPTIKAQWDRFLANVVPKGASPAQVEDTQSAFYAGAAAMMAMLGDITENSPDEDAACRCMSALDRELKKFMVELMARAMAAEISRAMGADVHAEVHDVTRPPAGEVH